MAIAMTDFVFDFRQFTFEHELRMLERGYAAARDALLAEIIQIEAKASAYEDNLANGGEWIGEREDGRVLWDKSQLYQFEIDDTHRALGEVRKAFVIALYHHWERSAAAWKGSVGTHEQLVQWCREAGYGLSPDLDAVRYLANHLKHGHNSRKSWLEHMQNTFPRFMPHQPGPFFGLSDSDLSKVAAVILASGPTVQAP